MKQNPSNKLVEELCKQVALIKLALSRGNVNHAIIEAEYCDIIMEDTFAEHPELRRDWNKRCLRQCLYEPAKTTV